MNICVFGDSLTYAGYIKNSWTNLLKWYLEENSDEDVELYNLGINGNTSEDILNRFKSESEQRQPDTIIFAYGINDSSYLIEIDKCLVEIEQFRRNTQELINEAKKITSKIIFVGLV